MALGLLSLVHNRFPIRRHTQRWTVPMNVEIWWKKGWMSQQQTLIQTNGKSSWTRIAASYYTLVVRNDTVDTRTELLNYIFGIRIRDYARSGCTSKRFA
jgi:hypothetical protein